MAESESKLMLVNTIDQIRENSVKDMDSGKGIQNFMSQNKEETTEKKGIMKVESGYVIDSVKPQTLNPTYQNPSDEHNLADELESATVESAATRKNQMAVMANTTTPEDLKRMQEEGFSVAESRPEQIITVSDQIKANIAKTGGEVTGDLSKEELEEIVGNGYLATQIAESFQQNDLPLTDENVEGIKEVSEMLGAIEGLDTQEQLYLVKNEFEPTVSNIYKAAHSAGLAMPTQSVSIDEFRSQVENVIANSGLEVNEETIADAKTLVENQIPLTEENLLYYRDLQTLEGGLQNTTMLTQSVSNAVAEGNTATDAMVLEGYSMTDKAQHASELLNEVTDEDLAYVIANEKEINLANLTEAKAHRGEVDVTKWEQNLSFITAKRVLEETRLSMTTEANLSLLKKGISIDTKPLEEIVENLKTQEKTLYENLLSQYDIEPTETNVKTYSTTLDVLSQLKTAPATILSADEVEQTLSALSDRATVQKADYEKVGAEYEKLWTAPRSDMGDSIQKAFRNVDDILADMDLELSESNRRAVRILAYNQNELTEENIATIKAKDEQMQRVFANLTPRTTLELIRRGENPIDMPLEKLNQVVEDIKTEIGDNGLERFEKFLCKLEQNKAISEEERSSYIGIYRLIAQVEKNDGAALGAAYQQGSDITMRSLLTQIRNQTKKNSDYTVDDDFEGVSAKATAPKIDRQIEAAFQNNCIKDVAEQLSPEMLTRFTDDSWMDMTPEQLKEALFHPQEINSSQSNEAASQVMKAVNMAEANLSDPETAEAKIALAELEQASLASEDVYAQLERMDMQATVSNVLAMQQFMAHPGNAISTIWKAKDSLAEAKEELLERFGEAVKSPTELADALETLERVAEKAGESMAEEAEAITSVDVRAMQLATKQITIATKQTSEESFLIPVQTSDGNVTGVSLKVVRGSGKKGIVDILFETTSIGKVSASFEAKSDHISGLIVCDDKEAREMMSQKLPLLASEISGESEESVELSVAYGEAGLVQRQQKPSDVEVSSEEYSVQTGRLYGIAKAFIEFASEF